MKTFGTFLYRLFVVVALWMIFATLYMYTESLQTIAMETRIANEIAICVADPNCTPNNEM